MQVNPDIEKVRFWERSEASRSFGILVAISNKKFQRKFVN
jgi:hypothetical protein